METIAERIRAAIEASGIKQIALASMVGAPQSSISKWKRGENVPSGASLFALADALGVDRQWLKSGKGDGKMNLLHSARLRAGMSIKQLSEETGYSIGVLQAVENGARASERMLKAIEKVLPGFSADEAMATSEHPNIIREDGQEATYGTAPRIALPSGIKGRMVPLFSFAQAGQYALCSTDEGWGGEAVLAMGISDPKAFGLRIEGDSMAPHVNPGDVVIVVPSLNLARGDTVIVKTTDDEVFCKLWAGESQGSVVLRSHNPAHPELQIPREQVAFIYPVAQVTKSLRKTT